MLKCASGWEIYALIWNIRNVLQFSSWTWTIADAAMGLSISNNRTQTHTRTSVCTYWLNMLKKHSTAASQLYKKHTHTHNSLSAAWTESSPLPGHKSMAFCRRVCESWVNTCMWVCVDESYFHFNCVGVRCVTFCYMYKYLFFICFWSVYLIK